MDKPVPNSFLQKQVRLLPPPFQVCIDRGGKDVEVQKTFSPAISWQLHGEVKEGMKDAGLSLGSLLMGHADEPSSSLRQGLGFSSGTKTCSLGSSYLHQEQPCVDFRVTLGWRGGCSQRSILWERKTNSKNNDALSSKRCLTSSRTKGSSFCLEIQTQNKGAFIIIDYKWGIVCSPSNFSFLFLQFFSITSQSHLHLSS